MTWFNYFFTIIFQETSLESFVTPLDDEDTAPDEYQIFRTVVQTLEQGNPGWYVFAKTFFYTKSTVPLQNMYYILFVYIIGMDN